MLTQVNTAGNCCGKCRAWRRNCVPCRHRCPLMPIDGWQSRDTVCRVAQVAQDHFLHPLAAPSLDSALQRPKLCFAGIHVRSQRGLRVRPEPRPVAKTACARPRSTAQRLRNAAVRSHLLLSRLIATHGYYCIAAVCFRPSLPRNFQFATHTKAQAEALCEVSLGIDGSVDSKCLRRPKQVS